MTTYPRCFQDSDEMFHPGRDNYMEYCSSTDGQEAGRRKRLRSQGLSTPFKDGHTSNGLTSS